MRGTPPPRVVMEPTRVGALVCVGGVPRPGSAGCRDRSGIVLDDAKVDELVRQIGDESTEWGRAASTGTVAGSWPRSSHVDG